jgi:hypothetical protein
VTSLHRIKVDPPHGLNSARAVAVAVPARLAGGRRWSHPGPYDKPPALRSDGHARDKAQTRSALALGDVAAPALLSHSIKNDLIVVYAYVNALQP